MPIRRSTCLHVQHLFNALIVLSMLFSALPAQRAQAAAPAVPTAAEQPPARTVSPAIGQTIALPAAPRQPQRAARKATLLAAAPAPLSQAQLRTQAAALFAASPAGLLADKNPSLSLAVQGDAIPGESLYLAWQADEAGTGPFELFLEAPEDVRWVGEGGTFDQDAHTLTLVVTDTLGMLPWQIDANARGPFHFQASLRQEGETLAHANLVVKEDGLTSLDANGGVARGLQGRVQAAFPPQDEPLDVRVRPFHPASGGGAGGEGKGAGWGLSGQPFEITAHTPAGLSKHQFSQPLTITIDYDSLPYASNPAFLQVYYFDEQQQDWLPVPTQVDSLKHQVIAVSDHLTVFDISSSEWEESRLPTLKDFQVSTFTGAASYSFNLWTPPAPAGLAPSLGLSYNSQVTENAVPKQTQASWVGMGWSLDTGAIERNQNGTPTDLSDDVFTINANGIGGVLTRGTDGYFHTQDESFWRIQRNTTNDTWTAQSPDGTQYIFGAPESSTLARASYPYQFTRDCAHDTHNGDNNQDGIVDGTEAAASYATWKWGLYKIRNTSGLELTFTYALDGQPKTHTCNPAVTLPTHTALYPETIVYPGGLYRVWFEREARGDYRTEWTTPSGYNFYETQRLKSVRMQAWQEGAWQDVRRYNFIYATTPVIFPYHTWGAQNTPTLTLLQIQETDTASDVTLTDTTTFTYDSLHLLEGSNSHGGRVAFDYEAQPWYDLSTTLNKTYPVNNPSKWDDRLRGDAPCIEYRDEFNNPYYISRFDTPCDQESGELYISGSSAMAAPTSAPAALLSLQPGTVYKVYAKVFSDNPRYAASAQLGLASDGQVQWVTSAVNATWSSPAILAGYAILPLNATSVALQLNCSGAVACRVEKAVLYALPSRYRVTQKRVYDGLNAAPAVFQYRYDEPATNDPGHSAIAIEPTPGVLDARLSPAYSEGRGHASVQEVGPYGRVDWSFFHQDDARKGRSSASLTMQGDYLDNFDGGLSGWTNGCGAGSTYTTARYRGDSALNVSRAPYAWSCLYRPNTLSDGEAVVMQFQVASSSVAEAALVLETGSGSTYRRFGVYAWTDGSLRVHYNLGGGNTLGAYLFNPNDPLRPLRLKRDTWYVLLLTVDDDQGFLARAWERDDPSTASESRLNQTTGQNWRFNAAIYSGALWLDTYAEGKLYGLNETQYVVRDLSEHSPFIIKHPDLQNYWVGTKEARRLNFEADGAYVATRSTFGYDSSGNQAWALQGSWDAGQNKWRDYRISISDYFTNTAGTTYLVGLPAYNLQYRCPDNSFDGTCAQPYPSNFPGGSLLGGQEYLYDNHTAFWDLPTVGRLTGKRTLLYLADGANYTSARYLDESYVYDSWGNLIQTTVYNSEGLFGRNLATQNARLSQTIYDSTYHTFAVNQINPLNQTTTISYTLGLGLPKRMYGPNGVNTAVEVRYDPFGRPLKIVRPGDDLDNPTMQFSYAAPGTIPFWVQMRQRIQTTQYATLRRYYDGLGQVVQAQTLGATVGSWANPATILVDTWYNAYGQATRQSVPYAVEEVLSARRDPDTTQAATQISYDPLGRPATVTAPDATITSHQYFDLETRVTNPRGNATRSLLDVWGRTVQVIPLNGTNVNNPMNPTVSYSYDAADRLTQALHGGLTTSVTYDLAGRKLSLSDPDMGQWTYTYYPVGTLKTQTDARACTTTLAYDTLNRLTGKSFNASCATTTAISFGYDYGTNGIGQRTSMSDATGSTTWEYDNRGQMTSEVRILTGVGSFRSEWGYNSAGLLASMRYPAGNNGLTSEQINYTYLSQMALNQVYFGSAPYTPVYAQSTWYDASGRMLQRVLGSSKVTLQYAYYPWTAAGQGGRLQQIKASTSTGVKLNLAYSYDRIGNVSTIQDASSGVAQTQTFGYDALDRLTSASAASSPTQAGDYAALSYSYSISGTLSTSAGATYTYGSAAHRNAVTQLSSGVRYGYDPNGNMTYRHVQENGQWVDYTLGYDSENHLTSASKGGVNVANFSYNGDGQRVKASEGSATTIFVGNYLEFQYINGNLSTAKITKHYYAGAERLAVRDGNGSLSWLAGDHLGSASLAVLDAGGTTKRQGYMPWGAERFNVGGPLPTQYQYTGQYRSSIGLYFYNARWYDPYLNRWTQPDTIVPDSNNVLDWDRYSYTRGNPTRLLDPSGHKPCDQDDENCEEGYGSEFYQWFQEEKDRIYRYDKWERSLIALAIYSESSNGTYPQVLLYYLGLVYANRVEMGLYTLLGSIIGSNSAIQANNNTLNDDFPELMDLARMSKAEISMLMDRIENSMADTNLGWKDAKAAADRALSTAIDPSGGVTNFRAANTKEQWDRTIETAVDNSRPEGNWGPYYHYTTFGPIYNSTMGTDFWIIFDNWDYCRSMTGVG